MCQFVIKSESMKEQSMLRVLQAAVGSQEGGRACSPRGLIESQSYVVNWLKNQTLEFVIKFTDK